MFFEVFHLTPRVWEKTFKREIAKKSL